MNIVEILMASFKLVWREKTLWVISALGVAFLALGNAVYTIGYFRWYQSMMAAMLERPPSVQPWAWMAMMSDYFPVIIAWGALTLAGYAINLAARGAGMAEADQAWQGERVHMKRGLTAGVGKAPGIFLIDLIWALPGLALGLVWIVAFWALQFRFLFPMMSLEDAGAGARVMSAFGVFFMTIIAFMLLGLIYMIVRAIFAPLMFQSLVLGEKPVVQAMREGWRLSKAHIKHMLAAWLLLLAIRFGFGLVIQMAIMPLFFMIMTSMFRAMSDPHALPGAFSGPLFFLFAVVMALASWVTSSLLQSVALTLYARLYRAFTVGEERGLEAAG